MTLVYGPFWRHLRHLPFVLVCLALGAFAFFDAGTQAKLLCSRDSTGEPRCEVRKQPLLGPQSTHVYWRDELRGATTVVHHGKGNSKTYGVAFLDGRGRQNEVIGRTESNDGERVDAFLKSRDAAPVEINVSRSVPGILFGILLVLLGLVLLRMMARAFVLLVVTADKEQRTIRVVQTWLGIPYDFRTVSVPERVLRVEAETHHKPDWLTSKGSKGPLYGRVVLHGTGGDTAYLTYDSFYGGGSHARVARKLAALFVTPDPWPEGPAKNPVWPVPQSPPAGSIFGGRGQSPSSHSPSPSVAHVKTPRLQWYLFGGGVVVVLAYGGVMMYLENDGTGQLSVTCEQRCRMESMECLPGGSYSMPLPPGAHTLEVWNPDLPTRWEPVTVQIRKGKTTNLTCRPTPSSTVH